MKTRFMALAIGTTLMLALAPGAAATTTRIPVAADEVMVSVIDPGTTGMAGSVVWARGVVWVADVTGDALLAGTDTIVINYDLDLGTGSGELWGKDRIDPAAHPGGHFACSWTGTFVAYVWTGHAVCHGKGTLDGQQLRLTIEAEPGGEADTLGGYAFVPGR